MSRSVSWRRLCTDLVSKRIQEALQSVVYILHQTGPTGYVLKKEGEEKKHKVFLGDPHTCTCSVYKTEKDLCVHILWLLLKKFRIPKDNPVIFQLGLVEREINEVLLGYLTRQNPNEKDRANKITSCGSCDQRPIASDDLCPICQDELLKIPQRLSYCRYGCGKSIHLKCIKVWAEHQKSQGETEIICPLCREKFCSFKELSHELHSRTKRTGTKAGRESLHFGNTCNQCQVCPIAGKCYKCTSCPSFYLCHPCFAANHHPTHSFHFKQHPSHPGRPAVRPTLLSSFPQSIIDDIQTRDLTENDYDLLLQLDNPRRSSLMIGAPSSSSSISQHLLNSLSTEPLDHNSLLITSRTTCQICSEPFQRGQWIRKLPCKHKFHRECIDSMIRNEGCTTCPIDGRTLFRSEDQSTRQSRINSTTNRQGHRRTGHLHSSQEHQLLVEDISISVSGRGLCDIDGSRRQQQSRPHLPAITSQAKSSSTICRGSVLNASEHLPSRKPQITADFSLQVTSLSSNSSSNSQSPSTLSSNKRRASQGDKMDTLDRRGHRTRRHHSLQPVSLAAKACEKSRKEEKERLPKIMPEIKTIHSALHVSSLHCLPPIDTSTDLVNTS